MNNKFLAVLLIITGLIWVLVQFTEFQSWGITSQLWPLFIIIPGASIMLFANSIKSDSEINALGTAILAIGLLLAYERQKPSRSSHCGISIPNHFGCLWSVYLICEAKK